MLSRLLTLSAAVLALIATWGATASTGGTWPMWALASALGVAAAVRPSVGLLLVAAFAPLGGALAALAGLRASWTEPLVLSVLTGWLLRRTWQRERWDPLAILAGLFALVVLTSLVVQCAVAYRVSAPDGLSFPRAMLQWLTFSSSISGPVRPEVAAALRMIGGLGLFVMAADVCRRIPWTSEASIRLLTLGVAGVAALSVSRFVEVVVRQGTAFVPTALHAHTFLRVSSTIPDLNAAGALFAMVLPVAVALATGPRTRLLWSLALVCLGAGLWICGSRAGMLGGAVGVVGYIAVHARRQWSSQRTWTVVSLLVVGTTTLLIWYPRTAAHGSAHDASVIRQQLAIVGFRMAREAPVFGVGVGRFLEESAHLATPELQVYYRAQNAHNQFIQILGELGLVGASLFVGVLACTLVPSWRQSWAHQTAPMGALMFGLAGFLISSLLMHPLLLPEVSAAFWLALGLARSTVAVAPVVQGARGTRVLVPALVVALLASLPARITAARNALDIDGVGVGLSAWRTDPGDGRRYRVATGRAAIYVDGRGGRLRVPLRVRGPVVDVVLLFDGRPAGHVLVQAGGWTEITMLIPPHRTNRPRFLRLDFAWSPPTPRAKLDVGRAEYSGQGER
jgi:O-antigen ligase